LLSIIKFHDYVLTQLRTLTTEEFAVLQRQSIES